MDGEREREREDLLKISVQVNLDDTIRDGRLKLLFGASRATVEDQEERLVFLRADLFLGVCLVLSEQLWVQADVAGLVDAVDVAEAGGNGEVWRDAGEGGVDVVDVFGLRVERVVVDASVVDAVFFSSRDADFLFPLRR